MKKSLIYFDANQLEDYMYDESYRNAYNEIISELPIFIWTGRIKNNKFITIDESGELVKIENENVSKILIRGKNMPKVSSHIQLINDPLLVDIFDNKKKSKSLVPKENIIKTFKKDFLVDGVKYVIKPVDGLKGNDILISSNLKEIEEHIKMLLEKYNDYLIEEFIEAQPFEEHKVYDIRVVLVNFNIVLTTLRTPSENSELCNVAKGGSLKVLNYNDLDDKLRCQISELVDNVYNKACRNNLNIRNSVFSIDFTIDKNNVIKVFEFNSYPGIRLEYNKYLIALRKLLYNGRIPKILV